MQDFKPARSLKNDLIRVHYYPDIVELRYLGYELERFEEILLDLDCATYRNALRVSSMLHRDSARPLWNAKAATEVEVLVLEELHNFGLAKAPLLLKNTVGRVYEEGASSSLTADLVQIFYWACLAELAKDYAWRNDKLRVWAEYLQYPYTTIFLD